MKNDVITSNNGKDLDFLVSLAAEFGVMVDLRTSADLTYKLKTDSP